MPLTMPSAGTTTPACASFAWSSARSTFLPLRLSTGLFLALELDDGEVARHRAQGVAPRHVPAHLDRVRPGRDSREERLRADRQRHAGERRARREHADFRRAVEREAVGPDARRAGVVLEPAVPENEQVAALRRE